MKIGLKLWSPNTDYYLQEAARLYKGGYFDYIELCIVPGTMHTACEWKKLKDNLNIPFALHAPHSALGINLSDAQKEKENIEAYEEVAFFAELLEPIYTVFHAGVNGSIKETIRQLNIIKPQNAVIENKPYKTIYGEPICRGAVKEEITAVLDSFDCGFCLDIGHAICAANSLGKEPYAFLEELNKLKPVCYHMSDNIIDSDIDGHMHFGQGNYDIQKILSIINKDKYVAIETLKDSKTNLKDFEKDSGYLKHAQGSNIVIN